MKCELFSDECFLIRFNANLGNLVVFLQAGDNVRTSNNLMNNTLFS